MNTNPKTAPITRSLDDLEERLPGVPSEALGLARATARRITSTATDVTDRLGDGLDTVGRTVGRSARTVAGQFSSSAQRTVDEVSARSREVAGQGRAQTATSVTTARDEAEAVLGDASDAVDPRTPLRSLTKAELYEMAQEHDIEGRSSMSKSELVSAVRAATS